MYVFPVPGGPWTTANSLVSANCKAWNCESSSSRSFADGQEAGLKTVTLDARKRGKCFNHCNKLFYFNDRVFR